MTSPKMDSLGQSDYKSDYKDSTMLTPTNMSFDHSILEYTAHHHMLKSPIEQLSKQVEEVKELDYKQKNQISQLEKEIRRYKEKEQDTQKELKDLRSRNYENSKEIDNLNVLVNQLQVEKSQLSNDLSVRQTEIIQLQQENNTKTKEINELNKTNREKDKQMNHLKNLNAELISKNSTLTDEHKKRLIELKKCEENWKQSDDELKNLKQQKQEEEQNYRYTLDMLNAKIGERDEKIIDLKTSITDLHKIIEDLKREKSFTENQAKNYRNQIESLKCIKNEEIDGKVKELNKYLKELNELNDKFKEMNQENRLLKESKLKQSNEIKRLGEMIHEREAKINDLETRFDEVENNLKTQLEFYKNQLDEAKSKDEELNEKLTACNEMIDQLNIACENYKAQMGTSDQKINFLKDELNEKNSSLKELKKMCNEHKYQISKLNQEQHTLTIQLEETNNLLIKYNDIFQEHFNLDSNKCQNWCLESNFSTKNIFSVDFVKSKLIEFNDEFQAKIQIKESKLKSLTNEYEDKLAERDTLIKHLEEEKINLSSEKTSSDYERSMLEKKYDTLVDENYELIQLVKERNNEILKLSQEINRLEEEKRSLESKLNTVRKEAKEMESRKKSSKEISDLTSNKIGTHDDEKIYTKKSYSDHNSNYLTNKDQNTTHFKNLKKDDKLKFADLNNEKLDKSPVKKYSSATPNKGMAELERKKLKEAQQKAEELLKNQGYFNKKTGKISSSKAEVCFNFDNLKDQTEDSSLDSEIVSSNPVKYTLFKEHLNFNDLERKKSLPSTEKQLTNVDEEIIDSVDLNKQKSDPFKKPANKFLINSRKSDTHFTSTPISKNTRVKKLNYDYSNY